ncbi:MAG: hypothetical protein ACFHWZ_16890 [Phycisphaerales bacterium]
MKSLLHTVVSFVIGLIISATSFAETAAPDTVILAVADASAAEDQAKSVAVLEGLVVGAEPGTRVQVYNAMTQQRIATFEIPNVQSERARKNLLRNAVTPVLQHLREPKSVRAGQGSSVDVPEFAHTLASMVRAGGGSTRVIIVGSPFHTTAADASMNFGPSEFPSDGHLAASSNRSIYSTLGREQRLEGLTIDWVLVGQVGTSRERAPVARFWNLFFSSQSAVLSSFVVTPEIVVERVLEGVSDPVADDTIDRDDKRVEILSINRPVREEERQPETLSEPVEPEPVTPDPVDVEPTLPEPVEPAEEPAPEPAAPVDVAIAIAADGTGSMRADLPKVGDLLLRVADLASISGDSLQLSVVVYRASDNFDVFPMTPILAGDQGAGVTALTSFVHDDTQTVEYYGEAQHERGSDPTGETAKVPAMSAMLGFADFEGGVRRAADMLAAVQATHKILLVVGDVGTAESDQDFETISADDRASEQRPDHRPLARADAPPGPRDDAVHRCRTDRS